MIDVTSVHYKMGNAANKSLVKVTNPLDPRAALGFISDCVDHAFNLSSSSSPVKSGNSGHPCCTKANSSTETTTTTTTAVPPKVPINDIKTEKKQLENCGKNSYFESGHEEKSKNQEEKENDVPGKLVADSYLNLWTDYQQPSTSKPKVINSVPFYEEEEFSETDEEYEDGEDTYVNLDYNLLRGAKFYYENKCIGVISHNTDHQSSTMPQPEAQFIPNDSFNINCNDNKKVIGKITGLLAGLAHDCNNVNFGPRSKRCIPDDSDSDSDSDETTSNDSGDKDNPPQIIPIIPAEDPGELGIPRTQRINKDGNPVDEKCTCHHHQVISETK